MESDDPRAGVMYTSVHADGTGAMDLYLKIFDISHRPYVDYDAKDRDHNQMMYPHMDGKRVYLNAVRGMVMSTQAALAKSGLGWDDIQWFVPPPGEPPDQREGRRRREDPRREGPQHDPVLRQHDGGDGAADDRPLAAAGQGQAGDRILASVFGSGFTWGAAIFTV